MEHFIRKLIAEGEHQMLDFKFEISDSRKIARTMVAFANTDGGRLLVGVKDNGSIAGVRTEEEFYMAEGAARLYCRPEVPIQVKEWVVEGRRILEVKVGASRKRPYLAEDHEGLWKAYIRQGDQNFLANDVILKVWQLQDEPSGAILRYREEEKLLLEYLELHERISLGRLRRLAGVSADKAEAILVSFMLMGLIRIRFEGEKVYYYKR
jgi:predicted HTH transcriptional regulator